MQTLLTDFRTECLDRFLDVLWRQWTALGVSGRGRSWTASAIDPDALLLFSCTMARYDARLFDAVLEWMQIHGRYINVQRTKRMLKEEIFSGEPVLQAMVAATHTSTSGAKWMRMARDATMKGDQKEALFFLKNGDPFPVVHDTDPLFAKHGLSRDRFEERGVVESFRPEQGSNLLLRLRALLGVNARCEILLFLLLNDRGSPRAMAKDSYYFPATISKALAEMSQSGYVASRTEGRHRYYKLVPATWRELFLEGEFEASWVVWARLFSALEQVWTFLDQHDLSARSVLAQASALRRILRGSVISQLNRCGPDFMFGDDSAHPGEALIPFFVEQMRAILDWVGQPSSQSKKSTPS